MALQLVFSELEAAQSDGIIERYAIGGAVAATFYIEPSATQDVDVFVVFKRQPAPVLLTLAPVYEYFVRRGATVRGEHLVIADWPVQFLPATTALVEDALTNTVRVDVEGQRVAVFTQEHLAAIALETGRMKDKVRLAQFLESGTLDRARFEELVQRFGLAEKWTRFTRLLEDQS